MRLNSRLTGHFSKLDLSRRSNSHHVTVGRAGHVIRFGMGNVHALTVSVVRLKLNFVYVVVRNASHLQKHPLKQSISENASIKKNARSSSRGKKQST